MSLRIGTNAPAMTAQRRMENVRRKQEKELVGLSSGDRISKSGYDPSGLAISQTMKARIRSMSQAVRNTNDGVSLLQVAEGSLGTMSEIGMRLKELAMQTATDTLGDKERAFANLEFKNLTNEIKRLSKSTQFNGIKLLDNGDRQYELQVGINEKASENRLTYDLKKILKASDDLAVSGTSVDSKYSAQNAISKVDDFIQEVSSGRAYLGSFQKRLEASASNMSIMNENTKAANSLIRDTDVAKAASEKAKSDIVSEASTMMLSQTTNWPRNVEKLLS